MKLKQELPEPFPRNPNPQSLKAGDRVVTDFYPDQLKTIRTIEEIWPANLPSGLGLLLSGAGQWEILDQPILIDAGRCLLVGPKGTLLDVQ